MPAARKPQDRLPKKTAARRSTGLDLDALEREGDVKAPFKFKHGGKWFTLSDPAELELADIVAVGTNPAAEPWLLTKLMGDQYGEVVAAGPMQQWKVARLLQDYFEYYGVNPGNSAA